MNFKLLIYGLFVLLLQAKTSIVKTQLRWIDYPTIPWFFSVQSICCCAITMVRSMHSAMIWTSIEMNWKQNWLPSASNMTRRITNFGNNNTMIRTLTAAWGSFFVLPGHWSLNVAYCDSCGMGKAIEVDVQGWRQAKRLFWSSKYNPAENKVKRKSVYLQQ